MTNQIPAYEKRNLSDSCKDCPDNRQPMCHCFDECIHPLDVLYDYEHERYQKAKEAADDREKNKNI